MRKLLFIAVLSLSVCQLIAQDPEPPSDLYGEDLKSWLRDNWYSPYASILDYSSAREEMYSYIDNEGGMVYCVYSGFHQSSEFTSFLDPINCEHTVPQSFFNELNPMKSDIHHLYPTHGNVNSARGNLPFMEIDDEQTETWFVGDESDLYDSSSIPGVSIDSYSELWTNMGFEPREDHKGDLARSVFYFYTMYPTQAGDIEELADLDVLYQWHLDDPVDDDELLRDDKIQEVQGNYNPYVRYSELAGKAWGFLFPGVGEEKINDLEIYPNPASEFLRINSTDVFEFQILDLTGKSVGNGIITNGTLTLESIPSGMYLLVLTDHFDIRYTLGFIKQ